MYNKDRRFNSKYISECDLINRVLVKDINQIPKINRIIIKLSSGENKDIGNFFGLNDTKMMLKILVLFRSCLGINPKITYEVNETFNYLVNEKESRNSTDSLHFQIVLEDLEDIEQFIHHFFIDIINQNESLTQFENKLNIFKNNAIRLTFLMPKILEDSLNLDVKLKEYISIKDLKFNIIFLINNNSKVEVNQNCFSIYPFWILI